MEKLGPTKQITDRQKIEGLLLEAGEKGKVVNVIHGSMNRYDWHLAKGVLGNGVTFDCELVYPRESNEQQPQFITVDLQANGENLARIETDGLVTMPAKQIDHTAVITITSSAWQKEHGMTTDFAADKMLVRHAQNESGLGVVKRIRDVVEQSKQKAAAKKLGKFNLSTQSSDLLTANTNTKHDREM